MAATSFEQLSECIRQEADLVEQLRELLDRSNDNPSASAPGPILDGFLETLPREFALEESDGYMSEVLEAYPNWSEHVQGLRRDHENLVTELRRLRDKAGDAVPGELAAETRQELRDWMMSLLSHHRHERRLFQQTFNLDIGAED